MIGYKPWYSEGLRRYFRNTHDDGDTPNTHKIHIVFQAVF